MIKGRLYTVPLRYIFYKLHLIRKSERVHVARNIDVQRVILVRFAQVVNYADEGCGASLRNSVVYNNSIFQRRSLSFIIDRAVAFDLGLKLQHRIFKDFVSLLEIVQLQLEVEYYQEEGYHEDPRQWTTS